MSNKKPKPLLYNKRIKHKDFSFGLNSLKANKDLLDKAREITGLKSNAIITLRSKEKRDDNQDALQYDKMSDK